MEAIRNMPQRISVPFSSIPEPIDTLFSIGFRPKYTELKCYQTWHIQGSAECPAGFYKINDETMMLITYDRYGAKSNVQFFRVPTYNNIMEYRDNDKLEVPGSLLWRQLNMKTEPRKNKSKFFSKKFVSQASREYQDAVKQAFIIPEHQLYNRQDPNQYYYYQQRNAPGTNPQYSQLQKNLGNILQEKIYTNQNGKKVQDMIQQMTADTNLNNPDPAADSLLASTNPYLNLDIKDTSVTPKTSPKPPATQPTKDSKRPRTAKIPRSRLSELNQVI